MISINKLWIKLKYPSPINVNMLIRTHEELKKMLMFSCINEVIVISIMLKVRTLYHLNFFSLVKSLFENILSNSWVFVVMVATMPKCSKYTKPIFKL